MKENLVKLLIFCLGVAMMFSCNKQKSSLINYTFSETINRIWIGPDFWANRLEDWKIQDGRVLCTTSAPNRNLFLLTSRLTSRPKPFNISVSLGFVNNEMNNEMSVNPGWAGFRLGIHGKFNDYRDDAVFGKGINIGISNDQSIIVQTPFDTIRQPIDKKSLNYILEINYRPEDDQNILYIKLTDADSNSEIGSLDYPLSDQALLEGGIALVSHFERNERYNTITSVWFDHLKIDGPKTVYLENQKFGPILFAQHTLSNQTLKITAQIPPLDIKENPVGIFEVWKESENNWIILDSAFVDPLARTMRFELRKWLFETNIKYRIAYDYTRYDGNKKMAYFEGVIKNDPVEKDEIIIAAFTGNNDLGFPNNDLVSNVVKHDPDFLFFSGDQIYEGVGGYGVQREPPEMAVLDYLRKWYMFGWTYRDLLRSTPAVSIPDDHDVFHGNIWGNGGIATPNGLTGTTAQDQGGYKMPPAFVNMVQRTQTSHLPDPYDPAPVAQGIGVYYTTLTYGGISFAIIEDRKFKSAPTPLLPKAKVWNGWPQNREFGTDKMDHPEAVLLGDRQLNFINDWSADWSGGVWMKVLLSQTIFANVATLPEEEMHDQNVPKLRILKSGEYPPNDRKVTDMDSNGWPQTGRDKAVSAIRKGFALHIAGDQHLGSTIQYGVDEYSDAGYAFCVPSVSNVWPRRWYPPEAGTNPLPDSPPYTGDYQDGFGNKMTVYAVSNPVFTGREPSRLYDRATGYGIVKINRYTRSISLANWPRDTDPTLPGSKPYDGWPVILNQEDNYGRSPSGFLPEIQVTGITDPVIQVINEQSNEIVYTIRINGNSFQPKVFGNGLYTINVGEPGVEMKTFKGLQPGTNDNIQISF